MAGKGGGKGKRRKEDGKGGLNPPPRRPFGFSGMDLPAATVLCWTGTAPVAGLAGFDLYRSDPGPGGEEWIKVNEDLLPLEGMFWDTDHKSLVSSEDDPFEVLLSGNETESQEHPLSLPLWVDLLRTLPNNPFALDLELEPEPLPRDSYCLVGKYLTGDRDGVHRPLGKNRDWTPGDIRTRDRMIQWALREIQRRNLVSALTPNPQNLNYAQLMAIVTISGDCGQLGGVQGRTSPAGRVARGSNRLKSDIVINGAWAIDFPPDDRWVALLLHEMAHALQNYEGLPAWATGSLIGAATFSVGSEIGAYESVWDRIQAGELNYDNQKKCQEIAEAISHMMSELHDLAARMTAANANPTPDERRRFDDLRTQGRTLLQKYRTFLRGLPAGTKGWKYRHSTGTQENLVDVVDRLLDQVFHGP